jgi:protocatechuate 3,4-dioxygenase beta subunit
VKAPGANSYSLASKDTTPASESFSYTPSADDGTYSFYTVAVDAIGNRESAPSQPDAQTLRDTTAPSSNASSPALTGIGAFSVTYTASDAGGSGVDSVELWAKAPGDSGFNKVATDTSPDSPSFSYNPTAGDGTYAFYTVAVDALGNREQAPSSPDTQTTRDTNAPGSTASAPAAVAGGPISVSYVVGGTGIASVELWAKAPGANNYSLADTDTTPDSPSFSYNPTGGDGTYSFYTVAVDNVGNREAAPADPDTQTIRDTGAPTSTASAPASAGSGSFTISYTAADPSGTGVENVELWAQAPGDTSFNKVATDASPDSPSFDYTPSSGDGTYYFYTVATDAVGNREAVPATADTHTVRNTAAPPPPASDPPAPVVAQLPAQTTPTAAPSTATTTQQPSLPLVAAVSMPGKQTLRSVLKNGLALKVYVYRDVRLSVSMTLTNRSAKQLRMLRRPMVARKTFDFTKPAVYDLRLRVMRRAVADLRRAKSAAFALKTVLTGSSGSSTSKSQLLLRRG